MGARTFHNISNVELFLEACQINTNKKMFWSALKSISQASDGLLDSSAKKLFLCITVGVFRNPKVSAIKKIKLQYNLQWQFFFWTVISFANSLDYTLCLLWLETNKFTWQYPISVEYLLKKYISCLLSPMKITQRNQRNTMRRWFSSIFAVLELFSCQNAMSERKKTRRLHFCTCKSSY